MQNKNTRMMLRVGLGLMAMAVLSAGTPIWGTAVTGSDLNDSRSQNNGLYVQGWSSFSLAWQITQQGNLYTYDYTVSLVAKNLSHAIVELSPNCYENHQVDPGCASRGVVGSYSDSDQGNSNQGLLRPLIGVKFAGDVSKVSDGLYEFTFTSDRAPVWGDFYAKAGANDNLALAYNEGMTHEGSYTDKLYFIARPDGAGVTPTPEPSTFGLIGLGLAGAAAFGKRKLK